MIELEFIVGDNKAVDAILTEVHPSTPRVSTLPDGQKDTL
ncbi:hypothetical protein J2TS6_58100 [Paenibacillus albilobatus]|uniref:Uncharacterized protein n=1 Tax=Paenibacillus albilobatus TaxID=2716884 RepID=A0A919XL09_9BACL|nr:hypothetical protein J2TS6_58100 [Paenibacillus albilobatus]